MRVIESFALRTVGDLEVGIEIEMEARGIGTNGENLGNVPKEWKIVSDGSLRGESCEWVLRAPILRKDTAQSLKNVDEDLKARGVKVNDSDRCGVHIHVNVQQFHTVEVINFILLYLIFEDLLVKYCGEDREGNLFCLRARDAEVLLIQLKACRVDENLIHLQNELYRYASVNVSAIQKYGSLEFRALKTPTKMVEIQPWIDMLLAIKDYAISIKDPRDIVESFSRNGEIGFLNTVFKADLAKLLVCKNAAGLMREGVRRIQDIAYSKLSPKKNLKSTTTFQGNPVQLGADPGRWRTAANMPAARFIFQDEPGEAQEVQEEGVLNRAPRMSEEERQRLVGLANPLVAGDWDRAARDWELRDHQRIREAARIRVAAEEARVPGEPANRPVPRRRPRGAPAQPVAPVPPPAPREWEPLDEEFDDQDL